MFHPNKNSITYESYNNMFHPNKNSITYEESAKTAIAEGDSIQYTIENIQSTILALQGVC